MDKVTTAVYATSNEHTKEVNESVKNIMDTWKFELTMRSGNPDHGISRAWDNAFTTLLWILISFLDARYARKEEEAKNE